MALILPTADNGFAGYLKVGGASNALLALRVVPARSNTPARFEACPRLRQLLEGQSEAVDQRLRRNADDVAGFLAELGELVERLVHVEPPAALPPASFYELIVRDLDAVGWNLVQSVSAALDELELLVVDGAGRGHTLGLVLPADYPYSPPKARVSLPSPFALRWLAPAATQSLATAIEQFQAALARHQLLWDMLDDLDAHTWVLEPKKPSREDLSRRLAIGSHSSLELELHEDSPASLPVLQFLGAEKVVAPLRHNLNARLSRWQPGRTVRANLEDVLLLQLPPPQVAGAQDSADCYAVECAICYSYHLEGAAPEIACDGCSKPFHRSCLSEWLRGLATTQQSFNRLFGECPYCCAPVACEAS